MNHNPVGDPKKVIEEGDFHRKENELTKKLRQCQAREDLAQETGITEVEILNDMQELGYTRDTIEKLLPLMPLVEVAWAEGWVTDRERKRIHELAARRGITEDTLEFKQLTAWLNEQPTDEFFHRTMRIIRAFLNTLTPAKRTYHRTKVIADCISVAKASGGLLGLSSRISETEMRMMEQIIEELRPRHP